MNEFERRMIQETERFKRNKRSREVAGIPEPDEGDESETPAAPLSKAELRELLLKRKVEKP